MKVERWLRSPCVWAVLIGFGATSVCADPVGLHRPPLTGSNELRGGVPVDSQQTADYSATERALAERVLWAPAARSDARRIPGEDWNTLLTVARELQRRPANEVQAALRLYGASVRNPRDGGLPRRLRPPYAHEYIAVDEREEAAKMALLLRMAFDVSSERPAVRPASDVGLLLELGPQILWSDDALSLDNRGMVPRFAFEPDKWLADARLLWPLRDLSAIKLRPDGPRGSAVSARSLREEPVTWRLSDPVFCASAQQSLLLTMGGASSRRRIARTYDARAGSARMSVGGAWEAGPACFVNQGRQFVTVSGGDLLVVDSRTGACVMHLRRPAEIERSWPGPPGWYARRVGSHTSPAVASELAGAAASPIVAVRYSSWFMALWNTQTGDLLWRQAAAEAGQLLAVSAAGSAVASGWTEGTGSSHLSVRAPEREGGRVVCDGGAPLSGAVAFSPDGTQIASLTRTGNAAIWDSRTGRLIRELDDTGACVYSIDWSADGQWLACLDGRGNLWVCAAKHGAWSFVAPRLGDLDSRVYFTGPSRISVVGRGVVRTVELPAARRADN